MGWQDKIRKVRANLDDKQPTQAIRHTTATVDHVTSGVAFLIIGADTFPAPHLAAYTPTAADVVSVLLVNNSPLILGKITGQPTI